MQREDPASALRCVATRCLANGSADRSAVILSALSANLAPSLDLLADIVQRPTFDQAEVDRVKTQTLTAIAQAQKEPNAMAARALPALLYGEDHPNTARLEHNLGGALHVLGDDAAAEPLVRRELAFHGRSLPSGHSTIGEALALLAEVRLGDGSPAALEEAHSCIDQAIDIWQRTYGRDGWMLAYAQSVRGAILTAHGRYQEAEPVLLGAFEAVRTARGVRLMGEMP
jgi:hypothetical protein